MNCRVQTQQGMGNLITRAWRSTMYSGWKTANPTDAQTLEPFVAGLAGEALYLGFVNDALAQVQPGPFRNELSERLSAARSKLQEIDRDVRQAAADAVADGHNIVIRENNIGMGVGPLIVVAIVAVAAVVIVCSYLGFASTVSNIRTYQTHKDAINAAIRLNRPDLIGQVVTNSGQPSGGGIFGQAANSLVLLGAIGAGLWFFSQRRRK